jgi:hypothetical protein
VGSYGLPVTSQKVSPEVPQGKNKMEMAVEKRIYQALHAIAMGHVDVL